MKKIIRAVLATTMVFAMGITSLAAPSISNTVTVSGAKTADGTEVELIVSAATKEVTAAEAVELLGIEADAADVAVVVKDVSLSQDADVFPLTITLGVAGVTTSHSVYVLHYTEGAWETIEATAGTDTVTFTVESLSPIAVVVEGGTSPQTGNVGTSAVMTLCIIALGTAFVVSRKKVA